MANRAIKQPNGMYARFSEVVDDFTIMNLYREELLVLYAQECGEEIAQGKLDRADAASDRFEEAVGIIEAIHGKNVADERRREGERWQVN